MKCEVCQADKDLLCCAFDDQPMLCFCPEDMVDHLEGAHSDTPAAVEMAGQIRELLRLAELTAYQSQVFVALTEIAYPEYSETAALALIAKHVDLVANYEQRKFEPVAAMRMLVGVEASQQRGERS